MTTAIQTAFPRSFPIIQRIKSEDESHLVGETSGQYIDDTLAVLGSSIVELKRRDDVQDKGIRQEFINQSIVIDRRFQEQRVYMDGKFEQFERKFERIDAQFKRIDAQFKENAAFRFNAFSTRGSSGIHPLPMPEPGDGGSYKLPGYFPRTVFEFWNLRSPQNGEHP